MYSYTLDLGSIKSASGHTIAQQWSYVDERKTYLDRKDFAWSETGVLLGRLGYKYPETRWRFFDWTVIARGVSLEEAEEIARKLVDNPTPV